ncbi:hypothetical protein [Morganella morganii]|uniref:hypothetical protein n=1 Tax=Morganella morganii TaxID=582 RepID=UPI003119C34C
MEIDNLQLLKSALFNISIEDNSAKKLEIGQNDDFVSYCKGILKELISTTRNKSFKFRDVNELVPSHVIALSKEQSDWEVRTRSIAEKLLSVEIAAQEKIEKLNKKIQKGSLLILLVSIDDEIKFVISKIEHAGFLDESEIKLKKGLPEKTRLQKSCLIFMDDDSNVSNILISDSGDSIREYWWNSFLSAQELISSELNTSNAFIAIDRLLQTNIKKTSPADYWFMRNDVISYFRNNESFAFNDLVDKISSHTFENEELSKNKDNFIRKLNALPSAERQGFDTQFKLAPGVIKAKFKKTIILGDNFELKINGEISDFSNKIKADVDTVGKYIKIYSDIGYKEFSGKSND